MNAFILIFLLTLFVFMLILMQYTVIESYFNPAILKTNDPKNEDTVCNYADEIYTNKAFDTRDCTVYFTSNIADCDNNYNPHIPCKYNFEGWQELKAPQGSSDDYERKVFMPNYTSHMNNHQIVSKCIKELDSTTKINYEYTMNPLVVKDCDGGYRQNEENIKVNNFNTFNGKNYASFKFVNDSNTQTNYNNIISTICSVKYEPISILNNIDLFRLELDANNNIINFNKVRLNASQTDFDIVPFNLKNFQASNAYKLAYDTFNRDFKIFSTDNAQIPLNIEIYKFNYNYLCKDSQILDFAKQNVVLFIDKLIYFDKFRQTNYKDSRLSLKSENWFVDDNLYYVNNATRDQRYAMINKLKNEITKKKEKITNDMKNNPMYTKITTDIENDSKTLQKKLIEKTNFEKSLNFDMINQEHGISSDYYLFWKDEIQLSADDILNSSGTSITKRIENPDFFSRYGGYTSDNDYSLNNWRLHSTSSSYGNEGINALLTTVANRNKYFHRYTRAYGAYTNTPIITIYMDKTYYLTEFEFYGVASQHGTYRNAKQITVDARNTNNTWINNVYSFQLPQNADWNSSPRYKLDKPDNYNAIRFNIKSNWGDNNSTKISNISLFHAVKSTLQFHSITNNLVNNLTILNNYKNKYDKQTDFSNVVAHHKSDWVILMHSNNIKGSINHIGNNSAIWGMLGSKDWRSITSTSTMAINKNNFGDGVGLYNQFFKAKNVTKIALVDGSTMSTQPSHHNNHLIYNLVESTGSETIYEILKRLDTYNMNNNWTRNDNVFNSPSATDFTAGTNGYSGLLVSSKGAWRTNSSLIPDKFCIWGVNQDSDNDVQVLCSYSGKLSTDSGKNDNWRSNNPSHTFWSYWGNDWHSSSKTQTISSSIQTDPGIAERAQYAQRHVYLMAYMDSELKYAEKQLSNNITVPQNKLYIYKIFTSLFLQKGFYKFTGFLDCIDMINMSTMMMELNPNTFVPVSYLFTSETNTGLKYYVWNTKDFIYLDKSRFCNICIVCYGYNKAQVKNTKPKVVYEYYSQLSKTQKYVSDYNIIGANINNYLALKEYNYAQLNQLVVTVNNTTTNYNALFYNYYNKTGATDKNKIEQIYQNIYTIYTNNFEFKNTYSDYLTLKGDIWGVSSLQTKIKANVREQSDIESHYKVLKGDMSNANNAVKYNGIVSTKDTLIQENENMENIINTLNLEKILTAKLGAIPDPKLNVGSNINTCIKTADNGQLDASMITVEKSNNKSLYLSIST